MLSRAFFVSRLARSSSALVTPRILNKNFRFPLGLRCLLEIAQCARRFYVAPPFGILKVALDVAEHFHVFAFRSASVQFFKGFPFHLGVVSPTEVIEILTNLPRCAIRREA